MGSLTPSSSLKRAGKAAKRSITAYRSRDFLAFFMPF
jgi:hypothetical protein